jgi:hypothetical protein
MALANCWLPGDTGHWARPVLEQRFRLVPLDYLSADALAPHDTLLLAQPRALSAEENVALDGWVRGGGSLLLFADPMMTGESRFNLGDRRRPQDVALLSPILTHWDLELVFDDSQAAGLRFLGGNGPQLPVNLAGPGAARTRIAGWPEMTWWRSAASAWARRSWLPMPPCLIWKDRTKEPQACFWGFRT